jgi:hypothetical protein
MHAWRTAARGIACLALLGLAHVPVKAAVMNQEQDPVPTEVELQPIEGEVTMPASPVPGPIDPALQPQVELAQQDLGMRLGMDNWWDIWVLEARAVTWPDGSLGCPQPGMAYIQVLVDGALVRLLVGDRAYEYHSGGSRAPFLCENPAPAPPADNTIPPPAMGI